MQISFDFFAHLESQASLFNQATPQHALAYLAERFPHKTLFATNFSVEDQVIADLIYTHQLPVRVFTRAGNEANAALRRTVDRYAAAIEVWTYQSELAAARYLLQYPEPATAGGPGEPAPLGQVLQSSHLLITGLRAAQLDGRHQRALFEWDQTNRKFRFHPLFYWTDEQLADYARQHGIDHQELPGGEGPIGVKDQANPRPGPARASLLQMPARRWYPGRHDVPPRQSDGGL